jgi:hypothetical protein
LDAETRDHDLMRGRVDMTFSLRDISGSTKVAARGGIQAEEPVLKRRAKQENHG